MHIWIPADLAETIDSMKEKYGKKYGHVLRDAMVLSREKLEKKYKAEKEALK